MTVDRIGAMRRLLNKTANDLDALRRENVKMQDGGRALGDYLLALGRGVERKLNAAEQRRLKDAIHLFGCR